MSYFPLEESSYVRYLGDEESTLRLIADRYMLAQPKQPFVYRAYHRGGLARGSDFRYKFNMDERFPDIRDGQYVYAWAKLWCEQDSEWAFSLSCYGPVRIYVDGEERYKANIQEEVFPDRRSWFRLKLKAGWNHFVLQFIKTGTGCGCIFGTGSIKGLPMHFITPSSERDGQEGWLFTEPLDEALDLDHLPRADTSETMLNWLPSRVWDPSELEFGELGRLYGCSQGQIAYGWTKLIVSGETHEGRVLLSGRHDGAITLYLDGKQIYASTQSGGFRVNISVQSEEHELIVRSVSDGGRWGFALDARFQSEGEYGATSGPLSESGSRSHREVRLSLPHPVQGSDEKWLYIGPFLAGNEPALEQLCMDILYRSGERAVYWRVGDQPDTVVRPYAESSHYGRWNYPLGVTLYGLLRTGSELNETAYVEYVRNHIEQCTSFDEYAVWDRAEYGAAGCNHQLASIDTLDDCGSFASVMLEALKHGELKGARGAAERVAAYISKEQDRLADGALYRVHGSTDFMQDTMWCDDLYMSTPFLCRYYQLTGEIQYIDDAAEQFMSYKKLLYMPGRKLMSHVYDFKFDKQTGVPWGRGNGWVLFSLTELLEILPKDHRRRPELIMFFRELSEGFLALQGENGLWHQVLDMPSSYEEASCTAMFVYAYARGIRFGWLPAEQSVQELYIQSVLKGWEGLTGTAVDRHGNIYGVCRGSGYSFSPLYYKEDLSWNLNDTHGIGIVLLAGVEAMQLRRWLVRGRD
jgi:unsaturated rhamnogalacturonyl hydrolase